MGTLAADLPALPASVNRGGDFFTQGDIAIHPPGLRVDGGQRHTVPGCSKAASSRLIAIPRRQTECSLAPLLKASRSHLQARIAEPLAPPADRRRAATVKCSCGNCRQLAAFLIAPGQRIWILRAPEQIRAHVEEALRRARADVDTVTERRGRPYSLICTKNQASYERRAAQRAQDLADVKLLDF